MRDTKQFATIVTGLPRSGTSLLMQMLRDGGLPILTDSIRSPDEDNPRGYLEFEKVKQLREDSSWLDEAIGKAVKIVHLLVLSLPEDREYRIILMRRRMPEVIASQERMLARQGKPRSNIAPLELERIFNAQLTNVIRWIDERPQFQSLEIWYHDLITHPHPCVEQIDEFLGGGLDRNAMTMTIDPQLYRQQSI